MIKKIFERKNDIFMSITYVLGALKICLLTKPCAEPEGGAGGSAPHPMKNHKNIGFLSNTDPDPLKKAQSCIASTQCWAIISRPAMMAHLQWGWSLSPLMNKKSKKNLS